MTAVPREVLAEMDALAAAHGIDAGPQSGRCAPSAPMPCRECNGIGEWEEMRTPSPIGRRLSPDFVVVRCEWCDGTGEEPCACCGEAAAVVETDLGPYCAACAAVEE